MSVEVEVTVVVVGAVEVFELVLLLELDGAVDATLESVSVEEVDVLLGALLAVFVEEEDEGLVDAVVVEEDGDDVFELVLLVFAEETSFFKDAWSDLYSLTFFAISLTRATLSVTSFLISDRIVLMVAISFFKSAFSVLMVFLSAVISALLSSLSFMFDFRSASSFFRLSRILSALLIAR